MQPDGGGGRRDLSTETVGIHVRPSALERGYVVAVLSLIYVFNSLDRSIMWVLIEPIKAEFQLTDAQLGLVSGFMFSAVYGVVGVPLGLLADRVNRKRLITACLTFWSAMTMLCGVVQSFWQLCVARIAVGAGESGSPPASMSIIADLYPTTRRATALGVYMGAVPVGITLAFIGGSWAAAQHGWRAAFLLAGAPGLILALVLWLTVREPRRGQEGDDAPQARASIRQTFAFIGSQPSLMALFATMVAATTASSGAATFMVSMLMRSHGMSIEAAGRLNGVAFLAAAIGVPLLGALADRLARNDVRWLAWFSAVVVTGALPLLVGIALAANPLWVGVLLALWTVCQMGWNGPGYSLIQALVPVRMRATATSIQYVLANLVGIGLGAPVLGLVSDLLHDRYGAQSLRYAMVVMSALYIIACASLVFAGFRVSRDMARVEAR